MPGRTILGKRGKLQSLCLRCIAWKTKYVRLTAKVHLQESEMASGILLCVSHQMLGSHWRSGVAGCATELEKLMTVVGRGIVLHVLRLD